MEVHALALVICVAGKMFFALSLAQASQNSSYVVGMDVTPAASNSFLLYMIGTTALS